MTYVFRLAFGIVEAFATFVCANFVRQLCFHYSDVLSFDFFGSLASRGFPSYLSFPSEGRGAFWKVSGCQSLGFPRFFLSFRSICSSGGGGGGEPLVARSVRASSLLSPRFIRELGIQELLSFS